MVEGITILNKVAITGLPSWIMASAAIILIIGAIIFVISIIMVDWPVWTAIIPFISAVLIAAICVLLSLVIKTGEYRYECIIDDSVSYNEVVENYKIVEQRGDIWVLEDK